MRKSAILGAALFVASCAAAHADSWQRVACSRHSDGPGGQPTVIRLVFNTATMTWWQVGAGDENNTFWADDRTFYLTTVNSLDESGNTVFTLDKATLRLEDETAGTVYRCRRDLPQSL